MATLATNVSFQCFGPDGKPLAGGKVYTYEAGTTTPKITYTNMQGDVPNPNPVTLDQNGKAKIFLADGNYRMRVLDNNDALVDDIDQISRYVTQSEFATFQQSVNDGVSQLTGIREQIDIFVGTAISNQKGFSGGIVPLDQNAKIDPIYIDYLDALLYSPIPWPKSTPPSGALALMGQGINPAQYPKLYAMYGGVLPDMRGLVIRGLDYGRGVDSGRGVLTYQDDDIKGHTHTMPVGPVAITDTGVGGGYGPYNISNPAVSWVGGGETRVKNMALLYIVKAG